MTDFKLGVENLETVEVTIEVAGFEDRLTNDDERDFLVFELFDLAAEADLLQFKDDVGHVFNHAGKRGEFVVNTFNADGSDCKAFKRREQHTTQRIANGDAIAWFQWTEFEYATEIVGLEHDHLVGFLER